MKTKVLVVMPEVPYPPRKNGLALRYYSLLQHLGQVFELHLAFVTDHEDTEPEVGDLKNSIHRFIPLQRSSKEPSLLEKLLVQVLRFSPVGVPFDYYNYAGPGLARQLKKVLAAPYDAVIWVTQNQLLYDSLPHLKKHRLIVDAVDSISLHRIRSNEQFGLLQRLRIGKIQRWEACMMRRAEVGFYISPVDCQAVKAQLRNVRLAISPNGVLIEDYSSEKAALQSPSLGFLGNMSYGPNIDAAHRVHAVYQSLKGSVPDLSLYIIGRDPDPSLQAYVSDPNVHITGTVDNIWPYVNAVDVFVMPMVMGAGQQNKLLEVMYAGRPIVASSVANGGVLAVDGDSVLIADDEVALREKVLELLLDPVRRESIATRGAKFVRENYSWDEIAARFATAIDSRKS